MKVGVSFSITKGPLKPNFLPNIRYKKKLKLDKKSLKKSFGFKKNGSDNDTEIGPWFRFPIPKPGFSRTLLSLKPADSELLS